MLAFARKLGREPNAIDAADIDKLRAFYDDKGILDIIFSVAGFNAMNRWTGGLAIPQEAHRVYLTPTAARYQDLVSSVAPLDPNRTGKAPACAAPSKRPPLELREEVERS